MSSGLIQPGPILDVKSSLDQKPSARDIEYHEVAKSILESVKGDSNFPPWAGEDSRLNLEDEVSPVLKANIQRLIGLQRFGKLFSKMAIVKLNLVRIKEGYIKASLEYMYNCKESSEDQLLMELNAGLSSTWENVGSCILRAKYVGHLLGLIDNPEDFSDDILDCLETADQMKGNLG